MVMPRKPTALQKAENTWRADRANPNEPVMEVSAPDCPSDLSKRAREEWKAIVPLLEESGIIFKLNQSTLACHCEFVAKFYKLCSKAKRNEKLIDNLNELDDNYLDDLLRLEKRVESDDRRMLQVGDAIRKFAKEFGLTPASLGGVNAMEKGGGNMKPEGKDKGRFFK